MSLSSSLSSVGSHFEIIYLDHQNTGSYNEKSKNFGILLFHSEDRLPPAVVVNKGLVLDENSVKKITTLQLSSTDQDSKPGELVYRITKQTILGHLELSTNPGIHNTTCINYTLGEHVVVTLMNWLVGWLVAWVVD